MFQHFVAFILFVGVQCSYSNYPTINDISHHPHMENIRDTMERSDLKVLQSNEILECNWEDLFAVVGLKEIEDLIDIVAQRKGVSRTNVLRMMFRRIKNKEEESLLNAIENMPIPDFSNQPIVDLPPAIKIAPDAVNVQYLPSDSGKAPYSLPPDSGKVSYAIPPDSAKAPYSLSPASGKVPYSLPPDVPMNYGGDDEPKVVIIPVAPPMPNRLPPIMRPETKPRKEMPNSVNPSIGRMNHVFSMLSPMKNTPLRPPLGAIVRVNTGDPMSPINRDITVTISPLMTALEALRQAEIKYQNVLGLSHNSEFITLAHSTTIDCIIVNSIDDVSKNEDSGWKVTITDRDGQVLYDNFCLPNGKEFLIRPGTLISLSYVPI